MLGSYIIPILFRPLDFLENFLTYVVGLSVYLFMIPSFTMIMQVYAFCNLHDISWGNRPARRGRQGALRASGRRPTTAGRRRSRIGRGGRGRRRGRGGLRAPGAAAGANQPAVQRGHRRHAENAEAGRVHGLE